MVKIYLDGVDKVTLLIIEKPHSHPIELCTQKSMNCHFFFLCILFVSYYSLTMCFLMFPYNTIQYIIITSVVFHATLKSSLCKSIMTLLNEKERKTPLPIEFILTHQWWPNTCSHLYLYIHTWNIKPIDWSVWKYMLNFSLYIDR